MRKVNLIPMAGEGQRFINAGYKIPKPLININGLPMVIRAAKCLPKADQWIFICRRSHIRVGNIDKVLKNHFPDAIILSVDNPTEGQVSTCLLARDYIFPDDQLTIGSCDNAMEYALNSFDHDIKTNDALIWTFRNNPVILQNPKMYGWAFVDDSCKVRGVSCKLPISDNPLLDHAIAGTFSFNEAGYFLECADKIINKNRRINNEFYIDVVLDECVLNGYNVSTFEINDYICWGTPKDLETYLN